jgi:hypothetical protein
MLPDSDWKFLAEQASKEMDPEKLTKNLGNKPIP